MLALSGTPGAGSDPASRSILLVSYFFPPCTDAGAHRPAAMAKYLRRLGYRVVVLSTSAYGRLPAEQESGIVRTFDLQLLRARLRGRRLVETSFDTGAESSPHPLSYVVVPEPLALAWAPFAVARAIRLHWRHRFDCVITTSPPESVHLVGQALRWLGVPWIADLRDGWTFEPLKPRFPSRLQRRLDEGLERRLMRAADSVTCVTEPLVRHYRDNLGAQAALVPNGWDPELAAASNGDGNVAPPLDPDRFSLVHTGRLGHSGNDPATLLAAVAELAAEDPALAGRLEIVFAGPCGERERRVLTQSAAPARISVLGALPRPQAIALQRSADALLLIVSRARPHAATAKVFEYIGAARPILALAEGTEAARIVRDAGAGLVVPSDDRAAVKGALRELLSGQLPAAPEAARLTHAYPLPAEMMALQVEAAMLELRRP
jgi:glycosyltransferase involved in cell wall biosynthesis